MSQAETNDLLQRRFEQFERNQLPKIEREAITAINASRLEVIDVVSEYAKKDNTISKARINALLRELEAVEASTRKQAEKSLRTALTQSAQQSVYDANKSVIEGLSAVTLAPLAGVTVAALIAQAALPFSEFITEKALAFGLAVSTIVKRAIEFLFKRIGDDKKRLDDRVWQYAGDLRSELQRAIRKDALQGRTINEMVKSIGKVYADEEWKVRRLVRTEALTAYRTATAIAAQKSSFVKALKIVDHPDGHPNHRRHECYTYARANEHNLGKGVYPTTETKILQPHPNCTSTLHYVFKEGVTDA